MGAGRNIWGAVTITAPAVAVRDVIAVKRALHRTATPISRLYIYTAKHTAAQNNMIYTTLLLLSSLSLASASRLASSKRDPLDHREIHAHLHVSHAATFDEGWRV